MHATFTCFIVRNVTSNILTCFKCSFQSYQKDNCERCLKNTIYLFYHKYMIQSSDFGKSCVPVSCYQASHIAADERGRLSPMVFRRCTSRMLTLPSPRLGDARTCVQVLARLAEPQPPRVPKCAPARDRSATAWPRHNQCTPPCVRAAGSAELPSVIILKTVVKCIDRSAQLDPRAPFTSSVTGS